MIIIIFYTPKCTLGRESINVISYHLCMYIYQKCDNIDVCAISTTNICYNITDLTASL